jgi:hypothetical protein
VKSTKRKMREGEKVQKGSGEKVKRARMKWREGEKAQKGRKGKVRRYRKEKKAKGAEGKKPFAPPSELEP